MEEKTVRPGTTRSITGSQAGSGMITTIYQRFPGYFPATLPSQGLWSWEWQWECFGQAVVTCLQSQQGLELFLSLTALQLKHPKNVIMPHYPLPRAF